MPTTKQLRKWYPDVKNTGTFVKDIQDYWVIHSRKILEEMRDKARDKKSHIINLEPATTDWKEADKAVELLNKQLPHWIKAYVDPFPCTIMLVSSMEDKRN